MNKIIKKSLLDELMDLCRELNNTAWSDTDARMDIIHRSTEKAQEIGRTSKEFVSGFSLQDCLMGILGVAGLNTEASNDEIYKILAVLGWEVTENV